MEGIGQKKETDYIFDKTIKCDVCGKEFKTKQVRTGKARFIGTDDILKPLSFDCLIKNIICFLLLSNTFHQDNLTISVI